MLHDWLFNTLRIASHVVLATRRMDAMVNRSRTVNGKPTSFADLGYSDVGLDDGWQNCSVYGPANYTYHTAAGRVNTTVSGCSSNGSLLRTYGAGNPVVNTTKFPNLSAVTSYAHSLNLTAGWYHNNCGCADHCSNLSCYQGDVDALIGFGFDSVKLDGCGKEYDLDTWSGLMSAAGKSILIENCHWGDTIPNTTWCPFNVRMTVYMC
jgi:hypothetical protein